MLYGEVGNDELGSGEVRDKLFGGLGDVLFGCLTNDILNAEDGADRLYGGPGTDALTGGLGADFFDCGIGIDLVKYYKSLEGEIIVDCKTFN